MITVNNITPNLYKTSEILNFPKNKIHIVCSALKKNSICSYLLLNHCNMDIAEIGKYCDLVNYKKESGCLYPKYNITLFPKFEVFDGSNITEHANKIARDIIEANEVYLKSSTILFIVDDSDWNNPLILKENLEKALKDKKHLQYLKEVFFYSY